MAEHVRAQFGHNQPRCGAQAEVKCATLQARPRSSGGQSSSFLNCVPGVRVTPGAPTTTKTVWGVAFWPVAASSIASARPST